MGSNTMKQLISAIFLVFLVAGCSVSTPVGQLCSAFPEWSETGFDNDVEHNSSGQVETGLTAFAGQLAEVVVDPTCGALGAAGVVSK